MNRLIHFALVATALLPGSVQGQDDDSGMGEIIVSATRISGPTGAAVPERRPVIGLKRKADSAVRRIEIVSDSREGDMRKREVQAMLLAALDLAKRDGLSLVTGNYEVVEVTRDNWRDAFPALAGKPVGAENDETDEDDEDGENKPKPTFEDDGSTATVRLMVKTKLDGSIANAQQKIGTFVKGVPATGRSQIEPKGGLALTIVNPDQYRDEIYRKVAAGGKHAASFYGQDYGVEVTGIDRDVAWAQVSNTEVFLYIPYSFTVSK